MDTTKKMPRELVIGDTIVDCDESGRVKYRNGKPLQTRVQKVEHYACSKRDTHVNSQDCYPWSIPVEVLV